MITKEKVEQIANKYQTSQQNIVREYCQHLFLSHFYQQENANRVLFKGGTALRIILESSRFSEDLDFSAVGDITRLEVENIFVDTLEDIEKQGIDVDFDESKETSKNYLGIVKFQINGYVPIMISIEVSFRDASKQIDSESDIVTNDFILSYALHHLPLKLLVQEKIEATLNRGKPRDFFDVYFMIRKGLIEVKDKKTLLPQVRSAVLSSDINFKNELREFLPTSQHQIISNFANTLVRTIDRNLGY